MVVFEVVFEAGFEVGIEWDMRKVESGLWCEAEVRVVAEMWEVLRRSLELVLLPVIQVVETAVVVDCHLVLSLVVVVGEDSHMEAAKAETE